MQRNLHDRRSTVHRPAGMVPGLRARARRASAHRRQDSRRGIAPLELVMALPVILVLLVGLLTLGSSGTALTEVTIKARNAAWRQRDQGGSSSTALLMLPGTATSSLVTQTSTQAGKTVSPQVALSPASAQHTVLAGAWDHHDLPMDSPPHWKLYPRLAAGGAANELIGAMDLVTSALSNLGGVVAQAIAESAGPLGQLNKAIQQNDNQREEENRKAREKLAADRKAAEKRIEELEARKKVLEADLVATEAEITKTDEKIEDLKQQIKDEKDQEKLKKLKEDLEQAEKDRKQLQEKADGLRAEIEVVKEDIRREQAKIRLIDKTGQAL